MSSRLRLKRHRKATPMIRAKLAEAAEAAKAQKFCQQCKHMSTWTRVGQTEQGHSIYMGTCHGGGYWHGTRLNILTHACHDFVDVVES